MIEMEGAAARYRRQRELVWYAAMLPHLKNRPTVDEFSGTKAPPKLPDWRDELSRWEAFAARTH